MKRFPVIISGFPGVGKSYCTKRMSGVIDSDSSKFSWSSPGVRNPDFPENYIKHVKQHTLVDDIVLVSTHKEVRDALVSNKMPFTLVYPSDECKDIYIDNYRKRGSSEEFIKLLHKNWEMWLKELKNQNNCNHVILTKDMYLYDILYTITGGIEKRYL